MKNKILKDKCGEEKFLSIWWFFVLAVVGVGIAAGVFILYSSEVDIRGMEAEVLSGRIFDCVVKQGKLIDEVLKSDFNIFQKCDLNENLFSEIYYFNVTIFEQGEGVLSEIKSEDVGAQTENTNTDIYRLNKAMAYTKSKAISNGAVPKQCHCGDECEKYSNYLLESAKKNEIPDPLFLLAIMMEESSCKKNVHSTSSYGLMQIRADSGGHCGKYGLSSDLVECQKVLLENPEKNIEIGAQILKLNYKYTKGAYQNSVKRYCKNSDYQQTYLSYEGWDSATRLYNGAGCTPPGANVKYVEEVNELYKNLKNIVGEEVPKDYKIEGKIIYSRIKLNEIISNKTISFQKDCEIQKAGVSSKNSAQCFSKEENIIYGDGKKGVINILTASDNKGKRIAK